MTCLQNYGMWAQDSVFMASRPILVQRWSSMSRSLWQAPLTTLWPAGNGVPEPGPSTSGGTRGRVGCSFSRVSIVFLTSFLKAGSQECDPLFCFLFFYLISPLFSQSQQLIPLFNLFLFGVSPLILLFLGPFKNSYIPLCWEGAVLSYFIYIFLNSQSPLLLSDFIFPNWVSPLTCIQSTLLVELGLKSFEMIVIPRLCDLHILHQIGAWLTIDNKLLPRDKMKEIYLKVS